MAYYPLLFELGSDAAQGYENNQVANQQDNILRQNLTAQQGYQANINKAVNGLLGNLKTDTPAKAQSASLEDYRQALDSALPVTSGDEIAGGSGATAAATLASAAKAFNLAGVLSKVQGQQDMRTNEGYDLGGIQDVVNRYRNFAQGRQGVTDIALKGTGPDPGYEEVIGALQTIGQKLPVKKGAPPDPDPVVAVNGP